MSIKYIAIVLGILSFRSLLFSADTSTLLKYSKETFDRNVAGALANDAQSQFDLGFQYFYGYGTPRNFIKAREWIRKAATTGHAEALKLLPSVERKVFDLNKDLLNHKAFGLKGGEHPYYLYREIISDALRGSVPTEDIDESLVRVLSTREVRVRLLTMLWFANYAFVKHIFDVEDTAEVRSKEELAIGLKRAIEAALDAYYEKSESDRVDDEDARSGTSPRFVEQLLSAIQEIPEPHSSSESAWLILLQMDADESHRRKTGEANNPRAFLSYVDKLKKLALEAEYLQAATIVR